jgi:hypothetical protein
MQRGHEIRYASWEAPQYIGVWYGMTTAPNPDCDPTNALTGVVDADVDKGRIVALPLSSFQYVQWEST